MTEMTDANSLNTPQFVREREAWYKAGAGAMASLAAIAVLLVGVIVGVCTLLFGAGPYQVVVSIILGSWGCIAAINFYLDFTARETARRGGIQAEPF